PGRPTIYATTTEFLEHFGLSSRRDLPGIAELRATGLLDPVEDAYDELVGESDADQQGDNTDGNRDPIGED
ncbi:MAG TPA: SMC-Scp complex subunit ScpB, partial [Erythrobacter sp.]|nr:SMC-Scp complex subunit ScpB [Erythrobacter sp.]